LYTSTISGEVQVSNCRIFYKQATYLVLRSSLILSDRCWVPDLCTMLPRRERYCWFMLRWS